MRPAVYLLILAATVFQNGCATMSAEDCTHADWRLIGMADGAKGEPLGLADRRGKDCARHGYVMDRTAYELGRDEGLNTYCVPGVAYQLGESGLAYNGVCSRHNENEFLAGYQKGRELYSYTAAAARAATERQDAEARHAELDARLDKYWTGYRDEDLTMEEHNTMVLELWSERKYLATKAIPYWQQAERVLSNELGEYRAKVAANDPLVGSGLSPTAFAGPEAWPGPTEQEAREMLQEVFSTIAKAANGS